MTPSQPPSRTMRLTEVGPRDGLQNQGAIIPTAVKIEFVNALSKCGFDEIEVSSFVSPKWIPQLGDAAELFDGLVRAPGTVYSALVPNEKGLDAALAARVDKIAVFTAASETFSQKNTNATIAQTLDRFVPVVRRAGQNGLPVRAYLSCAIACPYEGPLKPEAVRDVAAGLLDLGVTELDLGDTIGVAFPDDITRVYEALGDLIAPGATTLHLHDTKGRAVQCLNRAVELGVRSFDASIGGLGGCPFAPGAAGNVATEDVVAALEKLGFLTGIDLAACAAARRIIEPHLAAPLAARFSTAR